MSQCADVRDEFEVGRVDRRLLLRLDVAREGGLHVKGQGLLKPSSR